MHDIANHKKKKVSKDMAILFGRAPRPNESHEV